MASRILSWPVFERGPRLIDGHLINLLVNAIFGVQKPVAGVTYNITAHSGGGQANAFQLTSSSSHISVCAVANDSVKLPSGCQPGQTVTVTNQGNQSCQVYGSGSETINDQLAATGVALANAKTAVYKLMAPGKWYAILTA